MRGLIHFFNWPLEVINQVTYKCQFVLRRHLIENVLALLNSYLINSCATLCIHIYRSMSFLHDKIWKSLNWKQMILSINYLSTVYTLSGWNPTLQRRHIYKIYDGTIICRSTAGSGPMNGKLADHYRYTHLVYLLFVPRKS